MTNNIALILSSIEGFISTITTKLKEKQGYKQLSYTDLMIIFKIFCKIFFAKDQKIIIKFCTEEKQFCYVLEINSENIIRFEMLQQQFALNMPEWIVHVPTLSKYFDKGYLYLIIALLQGKGIQSSKELPNIIKNAQKFQVSDNGIDTILKWFFPYAGIGFVIHNPPFYLPLIICGGKNPSIKKINYDSNCTKLRTLTKSLRHQKSIPLALGFHIDHLINTLANNNNFLSIFERYGTNWAFSLPIEPDDFYIHFDTIMSLISSKIAIKKILQTKQSVHDLAKRYYTNLQKYLEKKAITVKLHGENKKIILRIDSNGLQEVEEKEECDFSFNVESLNTWSAWLNDKSLRLFVRFLDSVMPVHWFYDIAYTEVSMQLSLVDEKENKFQLFVYGSDHSSHNNTWSGDFCAFLVQNEKVIVYDELLNGKITTLKKSNCYEIFFPLDSLLENASLQFSEQKSCRLNRGICHLVSETSILSEISPGTRNFISRAKLSKQQSIKIDAKQYLINAGVLTINFVDGRETKQQNTEICNYNLLFKEQSYFLANANMVLHKEHHEKFIRKTEIKGVEITGKNVTYYNYDDLIYPKYNNKNGIIFTKVKDSNDKIISNFKFRILKGWLIPHTTSGTYKIKIVCFIDVKKQEKGWGILEFPCHLPKVFLPKSIVALEIKSTPTKIQMFIENVLVFYIQHPAFSVFNKWF